MNSCRTCGYSTHSQNGFTVDLYCRRFKEVVAKSTRSKSENAQIEKRCEERAAQGCWVKEGK